MSKFPKRTNYRKKKASRLASSFSEKEKTNIVSLYNDKVPYKKIQRQYNIKPDEFKVLLAELQLPQIRQRAKYSGSCKCHTISYGHEFDENVKCKFCHKNFFEVQLSKLKCTPRRRRGR